MGEMTFAFVPTPFTGRPLLQTGLNGRNIESNRSSQWRCAAGRGKKKGKPAKSAPRKRTVRPSKSVPTGGGKKDEETAPNLSSMESVPSSGEEEESSFSPTAAGPGVGEEEKSSFSAADPGVGERENSSFSSMAAGPGIGEAEKKMRGRLGAQKRSKKSIEKKTAADFIAEGIQDDVADVVPSILDEIPMVPPIGTTSPEFVQEDIRFGVGNVADPFLEDSVRETAAKEIASEEADKKSVGKQLDVTGDGGVLKRIIAVAPRGREIIPSGASVTVSYIGKLEDGTTFDSNEEGFQFTLGTGTVIKGWESGVSTMKLGEKAEFELAPKYAYGRRGVPPTIPGNSTLTFTIGVLDVQGGGEDRIRRVEEFNPSVKATPEDIARDYGELLETQGERKKGMSLFERFYIISPFASQTGEKPPWWLNPRITFFLIFASVGVAFYFTVLGNGIYQGIPDEATRDVNIFFD